ncbi:hypothetical protein ABW21_db0204358 [Orbilia brochopaga]|nr:hypothetical protein ABW21_db0204358 [Drechslerella brochopaga]
MFLNTLRSAFIGLPIASAIVLSLPSCSLVRHVLYPVPALLAARAILQPPREDSQVEETYLYGLFSASLGFRILDYLYLHGYNTPKYFYQVTNEGNNGSKQHVDPNSTLDRIKWGLSLLVSQRGIGWNFEVPLPDTTYPATRKEFIRQSLTALLKVYLGLYLCGTSCQWVVELLRDESQYRHTSPFLYDLCRWEPFQMLVSLAGWIVSIIGHVSVLYNFAAILCVGFGIGGRWKHMSSWPKTFGSFWDAWSIRTVWGKAWHQTLRRVCRAARFSRSVELNNC